jgi:hypothetical protein
MATLSGRTIASSYTELLKTTSSSGVTGSLDTVQTSDGAEVNDSALQLSETAVKSLGTLTSIGNLDVNTDKFTVNATSGNSTVGGTLGVTGVITATAGAVGDLTGDIYASNGSSKILESGTDGTDATFTGLASKSTELATARNIALTGDATGTASFNGTANASIATTLATVNTDVGTYGSATKSARIVINGKGLITGASEVTITGGGGGGGSDATSIQGIAVSSDTPTANQGLLYDGVDSYDPVSVVLAADAVSTNTASKVVKRDGSGNFAAGTITAALTGNASTATALATGRDISLTGDATGTATAFDGSATATIATTLATVATAATKGSASKTVTATINVKGLVTSLTDQDIAITSGQVSGLGTAATLAAADANWNANELQGRDVATTAPDDGQTLSWNDTSSKWEPTTGAATNANQLQGRDIANVAPTDQYVLLWDNGETRWEPAQITTSSVTDEAVTYAKIQDVSATDKILGRSTADAGVIEEIACTAVGRALIDDATVAAQRITLGLEIDADVQAYDADTAKTDVAQTFTAGQRGEVTPLTDAATVALDFDDSNNFSLLTTSGVGSTRALGNPSNLTAGQSGAITLTQDGSGSRLLTYASYWMFVGGTAPTLTTTADAVDVLVFYSESATRITAKVLLDVK